MNCPYCDESISLAAKFCPKCGLPLKEDATLMGAHFGDDASPNRWLIGAGAAAIVAVALSIGWISTHGQDGTVTRRQSVGVSGFPQPGSVSAYTAPSGFGTPVSASGFNMSRGATTPVFNVATASLPDSETKPAGWKPLPPLATVVRRADDDTLVTSVGQVAPGDSLRVRVADGTFDAVVGERVAPSAVERK